MSFCCSSSARVCLGHECTIHQRVSEDEAQGWIDVAQRLVHDAMFEVWRFRSYRSESPIHLNEREMR